jgi:hypothetical protein
MSANGQYQITSTASSITSQLYLSINFGQSWTIVATSTVVTWSKMCMSTSGQYQYAISIGTSYGIYYSTNYGQSWASLYNAGTSIASICCSANGQYISFTGYLTPVYYSSSYGQTFTQSNAIATNNWTSVCMSS